MRTCFFTLQSWEGDNKRIRLLVESLRTFGGKFKDSPVWIFQARNIRTDFSDLQNIQVIPLHIQEDFQKIFFSAKVFACAKAEEIGIKENIASLIWFGSSGFIIQPPEQFDLGKDFDATFRPVHHKNVGQLINEKLDDFWREIYDFVGLENSDKFVETFVEGEKIQPYFNSHLFSINPQKQILQKWKNEFIRFHQSDLPKKPAFSDQLHQIFIHQALMSAILVKHLGWDKIRILSEKYSYPLHLHHQVPPEKQLQILNELVCPVYEDVFKFPETLNGLKVEEPLAGWLKERKYLLDVFSGKTKKHYVSGHDGEYEFYYPV
jgi:hypothetical protein